MNNKVLENNMSLIHTLSFVHSMHVSIYYIQYVLKSHFELVSFCHNSFKQQYVFIRFESVRSVLDQTTINDINFEQSDNLFEYKIIVELAKNPIIKNVFIMYLNTWYMQY